jgi:hypothetical protein
MPYDPQASPSAPPESRRPEPERAAPRGPGLDWATEYREGLPYWQQRDPVPPEPSQAPVIETPGEALTERQEAFCRAYVECPVAAKAARAAGYAPAAGKQQASRLLKHPLVIRRIHELRDMRGVDWQVRRDTLIDQAEAVFESAMEKCDHYAAMQALTMKARLAGFADYLPGVRILRRDPRDYEQEFWARAHAAEQRITALRIGQFAGAAPDAGQVAAAIGDAEMHAEGAEAYAQRLSANAAGESERRARTKRSKSG